MPRAGLPLQGIRGLILEQINELFDLRRIPTTTEAIPEDVQVLMIVHLSGLASRSMDQFVYGGRALVFIALPSVPGLPPPVRPSR